MDREKPINVSPREFRSVMGRFATGVTVVAIAGDEGLYGLTVNAFTSVSLDPMQVLVCIDKGASGYEHFKRGRGFTVNILAEEQEDLSTRFANKDIADRFTGVSYTLGANGAPILNGVVAYLECRVMQSIDGGDHTIFLGEVERARVCSDAPPLLFYAGKYNALRH